MNYLFASRHKGHRFKSPGGYLCETGIFLLALSRYNTNIRRPYSVLVERKKAIKTVLHPGKGGCADPVNEDAILERVGGRAPGRGRERQLASDTGDGKT